MVQKENGAVDTLNWLLESEPYVQYATRINILKEEKQKLADLRNTVLRDDRVKKLLYDISDFYATTITSHKNAELSIHKLLFLLDIGLDADVQEIGNAVNLILKNKGEDGLYKSAIKIPTQFGGTGKETLSWCLCDAPLMLYALLKAGVSYETHAKSGVDYIAALHRSNGFPCAASKELGKFRGPGRREDCCPYATLIILKLFAMVPEYAESEIAKTTAGALLDLWKNSREQHPFIFYMGTDFRKLKAPAIWYDIVSMADCLCQFSCARKDRRFQEMLDIIESKASSEYRFTPESVYMACKDWDFGQKKQPSPWLTYLCLRILERSGRISVNPGQVHVA